MLTLLVLITYSFQTNHFVVIVFFSSVRTRLSLSTALHFSSLYRILMIRPLFVVPYFFLFMSVSCSASLVGLAGLAGLAIFAQGATRIQKEARREVDICLYKTGLSST